MALPTSARRHLVALRGLLVMTLVTGLAYPLVVTGLGQVAFHHQANGSLLRYGGRDVGSRLLGQAFTDAAGRPLPGWFQGRPGSYDGLASGASNLGPNSSDLVKAIAGRRTEIAQLDGTSAAGVPADAVTGSGSGLDPDISPAYAYEQVDRVARVRGLDPATVRRLVDAHVQDRTLGFLGEPRVNVLRLNLALLQLVAGRSRE